MRQQRDPYERIPRTPLPDVLKKRSAKKDFRATSDGVKVPVAAYPITYWVVGGWTASELADTDHCQQGPFLAVRKFDAGGANHFKPWDYEFERTHLAAFSAVMVDQQREVMALHAHYGHQNFDDLKETLTAKGIDIDEDCRRSEKLSADWRLIKGTVWIVDIWFFKDLLAKAETGGFGMMVVLYEPEAGFSLAHPVKEKDEASLIDCAHYFACWLGCPHLVCIDGEKAGAGISFQSWLRGDGSPGLYPIKYHQGPPYVGKGLQALVEHCIHSNREGVALFMSDPNHRFPLAVIHLVAMGERWGYSCAFHRTVGGISFTLTFQRAPPGWRVGDTAVVSMPSLETELRGVIVQFLAPLTHDVVAVLHRHKERNVQEERFTVLQVHPEHLQTVPDNLRLWGGPRFDQDGTILLDLVGGDQEDLRLWKTSVRQEGGTGTRYHRRAEPSDPSPAQAEASVREAGAADARARSPSLAVSNRASIDSGESPLPDFFVPLGSSMKGTILDLSGPRVLRTPGTVRQHNRAPSRGRWVNDPGPVFCDEKGNRLLGADGEPLGYNWKVERPVFMTYRRGVYDLVYDAWTRRFALMLHPDLGEITQGEVLDTLKNYLAS
uniref:Uncharacterized protein n=1 Tax=Chromera velia CCMP2878 TaxID=1169474 RepID=A0A0G4FJP3_9ALVE|eukprot:Cvel_17229.t1-p1 / transcript=Cvel_17229.t1 / gene=Cvel_17229 / organism=Chromera_velia_CCMP2878 / gene_product=hypothetical protein / transcript_product=hypothetical protein / location=Cvel_scaffold1363:28884-31072(+) / protein_length=606 / sequence_SO=supercontig / SO=protein_coding / is_pseudo=false